jgi:Glycosyl transferase family 2
MITLGFSLSLLSLLIWLYLLSFRGQFWRTDQQLPATVSPLATAPPIAVIIPARNEADMLPQTLRSLLTQDYPGPYQLWLVDDHSTDGTADVARSIATDLGKSAQLTILASQPLPPGWSGKLWALEQGIQAALGMQPDYCLLTDADIAHDRNNLQRLVAKAEQDQLDLVSQMVRLRCESNWEKLLIPAFVFFFAKLYPFRWVNQSQNPTAAAAGGCSLIRREALVRIGGIGVIRQALIDDCALAQAVKHPRCATTFCPHPLAPSPRTGEEEPNRGLAPLPERERGWGEGLRIRPTSRKQTQPGADRAQPSPPPVGRIWLGLTDSTRSLRPYPSLKSIWDMVARTAFTQLNYSPWLLVGTVVGMTVVYLVPPIGLVVGIVTGQGAIALLNLLTYGLMTLAYLPIVRFYQCPIGLAACLPIIALLYNLMTLDSARRHWQGRGGGWKGRVYPGARS